MSRVFTGELENESNQELALFYSLLHAINRLAGFPIFNSLSHFLAVKYAALTTIPLLQLALLIQDGGLSPVDTQGMPVPLIPTTEFAAVQ